MFWGRCRCRPFFDRVSNKTDFRQNRPEEYDIGHIPGAANIPYDRLTLPEYKNIISQLDKKRHIVVYGNTHQCIVSYSCAEDLMSLGFNRVVIAEGHMRWVERGYPIEKSVP
jgi:rhodanese-related sulfurtransferase